MSSPTLDKSMSNQRQAKVDAANKERMRERTRTREAYFRLFLTSDGKTVLEDLRKNFGYSSIAATDAHQVVVVASRRSVVDYIDSAIEGVSRGVSS